MYGKVGEEVEVFRVSRVVHVFTRKTSNREKVEE